MRTSDIADSISLSFTRHLFNLAKEYDDVINFTLGDPDLPTAQAIKDAGCEAIQKGYTHYSQNAGLLDLRKTISRYYEAKEGFSFNPESEVIVTVGAMEGLYLALLAMLNPGDEVIIPAPYYINYVQMVRMCHAVPVIIESKESGLSFNMDDVAKAVTPRTRAIMINTPGNPTGKLIPWNKIEAIAELAMQKDLVVISDEVYKCLIYTEEPFKSIAAIDGMRERTVLVNSLSKEFCMTGWRIGYVLAPKELIAAMTKLQENVAACAPLPSQYAAIEALGGRGDYSSGMVDIFRRRRDLLVEGISKIGRLSCEIPDSTFYLMVDVSKTGMKSVEFAMELLKAVHVAVVPGITYGNNCDNYIRIAFTIKDKEIVEGLNRIKSFVESL